MSKYAVILPAAGSSSRFQDRNYKKPFVPLGDRAVWLHTAEKFLNRKDVVQTILVISSEDREMFVAKFGANIAILGVDVVEGGAERADSVRAGLERVKNDATHICIHDAVRPCVADEWIDRVFESAEQNGAAILAVPVISTLKRSQNGKQVESTVSRDKLWEAQTPQVFRRDLIESAYARRSSPPPTDDAQAVEQLGHPVTLVTGSRLNIKITTREDLRLAEATLKALPKSKLADLFHPFADDNKWR
jgi:2-C-methyl-D-erythritol 4-phosphate cytidylyltransferase